MGFHFCLNLKELNKSKVLYDYSSAQNIIRSSDLGIFDGEYSGNTAAGIENGIFGRLFSETESSSAYVFEKSIFETADRADLYTLDYDFIEEGAGRRKKSPSKTKKASVSKKEDYSLKANKNLMEICSGFYKTSSNKSAFSVLNQDAVSKNTVTPHKSIQLKILKSAGIDTSRDIAGKDESIFKFKSKDGSVHYYKALRGSGEDKIIHTKIKNGNAEVKLYAVKNKSSEAVHKVKNISYTKKILGSAIYNADGKITAEDILSKKVLSNNASPIGIQEQLKILKAACIDTSRNIAGKNEALYKTKQNDGSVHYYKVVKDDGKNKIIHTKITNRIADVKVYELETAAAPIKTKYAAKPGGINKALGINGKIDRYVKQGGTGDCWLISGILAMNASAKGRDVIRQAVIPEKDGSVTVSFRGADKKYNISASEIKMHDTDRNLYDAYSNGDNDMLVLELAMERLRKETKGRNLNGGHSNEIWRAIVPNADVKVLYGKNLTNENIDKILKEAAENKNTVLTFSLGGSGHGHSALCAGGRIFSFNGPPHGFAAVKISEDKISFADPHNSKDLKTMSIKQFKKLNPSAVFSINL